VSATASERLTRQSGTNFYYAFRLLPAEKRRGIIAVWDFCRAVDDAVDHEPSADRAAVQLARWRRELAACYENGRPETPQGERLLPFVRQFGLPRRSFEDLIDGVEMDVGCRRYATFDDLHTYCLRVASAVGDEVATRDFHFRIVPTPGHSMDHISLFEDRRGWLFAGDLYLAAQVKVLRTDEDPHGTIASLRRVLALPVTTLYCASGKIIEDGRGALQRKLDFMERLGDESRRRAAKGMDARRIRLELLGPETWWPVITGGHFSKQNLIAALLRPEPPVT